MKIVIAGDGKVGSTLTRQLSTAGYEITLIDSKAAVLEKSMNRYDVMTVCGNCASMEVLEQAEIKEADLLIAATSADEINLLCCLEAHVINPNLHTIARIRNPEYNKQIYRIRDVCALSLSVNPERQAATEIQRFLHYPGFLKRDSFARARAEIVELEIRSDSRIKDCSLIELYKIVKCRVLVCIVQRGNKTIVPDGNFVLKENDKIFVTAPTANLTTLLRNLGIIQKKVKKVMICGGGRISYYLSKMLRGSGMQVKIIEKEYDRCEYLSEELPGVEIVYGDATELEVLEQEGLQYYDALVSLTGMDEINMLISMYGKDYVPQIITKLGHMENKEVLNALPLGRLIYPKGLCCDIITRYVRAIENQTGAAISVHSLADGAAEASEFRVEEAFSFAGMPLKELTLKKNVLVCGILHKGQMEIPNGDSVIMEGDTVIIVTTSDKRINTLKDIFVG